MSQHLNELFHVFQVLQSPLPSAKGNYEMRIPLTQHGIGVVAMLAPVWFTAVYLAMSSRRPEYSHLTKAISELGSLDAPDGWVWNFFGTSPQDLRLRCSEWECRGSSRISFKAESPLGVCA